jgi:hypothetical protein
MAGLALPMVSSTFFVQNVRVTKSDLIYFDSISTIDGSPRTIKSSDVSLVDGMPLQRLASIYSVNESGGSIKQGKRRGRRPNKSVAEA